MKAHLDELGWFAKPRFFAAGEYWSVACALGELGFDMRYPDNLTVYLLCLQAACSQKCSGRGRGSHAWSLPSSVHLGILACED